MDKIYLRALYLSGPTVTRPVNYPLAVKLVDNRLYISKFRVLFRISHSFLGVFVQVGEFLPWVMSEKIFVPLPEELFPFPLELPLPLPFPAVTLIRTEAMLPTSRRRMS